MEAEVTITIMFKASASDVPSIVSDLIDRSKSSEVEVRSDGRYRRDAIKRFLMNLTTDGRRVVEAISNHSVDGQLVYRNELANELSITVEELNGYLGSVGKWSSRGFGSERPFAGKRESARTEAYYQVDRDLAALILEEVPKFS